MIHLIRGKAEKSRKELRESLDIFERRQGEHPDKARTLYRLASVEHELGRSDEARRLLDRADTLARKLLGDEHYDVAMIQAEYGAIDLAEGKLEEAARRLEAALPAIEKQPTARSELAWARWRLARALAETEPQRARQLAEQARDGFDSLPGKHPWQAKAKLIETWMQDTFGPG
jgi:tetratricopeptide (TPR) repeat protein